MCIEKGGGLGRGYAIGAGETGFRKLLLANAPLNARIRRVVVAVVAEMRSESRKATSCPSVRAGTSAHAHLARASSGRARCDETKSEQAVEPADHIKEEEGGGP